MLIQFSKLLYFTIFHILAVRAARNINETEKYTNYAHSIIGLGELIRIEAELIGQLEKYEEKLIAKLEFMKFLISDLRAEQKKSEIDPDTYLKNPLNGFALVRRTHSDWVKWYDWLQEPEARAQIDFIEKLKEKMPKEKDVDEAVMGILRIQDTYEMSTDEMASGFLHGKQYDASMSAFDCFVIGNYLQQMLKWDASLEWYNVSLKLFNDNDRMMSDVLDFHEAHVWHDLADVLLEMNLVHQSLDIIEHAIQLKPNDEMLEAFKDSLVSFIAHEELCRGNVGINSKLQCRYNHTTSPFLKLAPLKFEEISHDPYIVLYHDIIYDHEIEQLKSIVMPRLERGLVVDGVIDPRRTAPKGVADPKRTVQVKQFEKNGQSDLLDRIQRRVDDMSGFDWTEAKPLQVANYGIGGHYFSHTDYFNLTSKPYLAGNTGDRIAAVLLYMSDVEKGGATVFPKAGAFVQPRKGSALLWYNLDNAGNGNPMTMHASCPVLLGSKWIGIQLAFHWPQMFIKQCHKEDR